MEHRRAQREEISERGSGEVWGRSPVREMSDSDAHSEVEDVKMMDDDHEGKKKKKSKKEKKAKKKKKKSKKKKKKKSSSSDESGSEDEWVEKDVMDAVAENKRKNKSEEGSEEESDDDMIGPALPKKVQLSHKDLGTQLLRGEGEAMAAYIADGKYLILIMVLLKKNNFVSRQENPEER